jgi:uncharacterized protein YbjT (DUF2867 family)
VILVSGATGLTGGQVVRRLSARGVVVRALVRNAAGANAAKAAALSMLAGVEIADGDMARPDTLASAMRGVDRAMLISSADPAMAERQMAFIDAAARAGVGHVVKLSGNIPDPGSPFRFARMHGDIERHLEASGLVFTHLRAGEFMHAYFRQLPSILGKGALSLPMADARIASVDIGDIAQVAADVLTGPGHEGKIYPLTGPEALTMTEVADRLSAATGNPIRYINVLPEEARAAQLAAGMPVYLADALTELFAERRDGREATVSPVIHTVFGYEATSFGSFARRHAAVFRGEQPPATI